VQVGYHPDAAESGKEADGGSDQARLRLVAFVIAADAVHGYLKPGDRFLRTVDDLDTSGILDDLVDLFQKTGCLQALDVVEFG
jgi:hypothetical protein